jgi:hypothetical protein
MSEAIQIILGILFLVLVFIVTRYGVAWRIKRACILVMKYMEIQGALDADSAVELPFAKRDYLKIGLRDFRPKALEELVGAGIVGMTAEGRYYLKKRLQDIQG